MSFNTQQDQQRAIEAAHVEQKKRETVARVYAKYPTLIQCMANDRQIIAIIERFAGLDVLPSLELFQSALDENPDALRELATQPVERTREQITEEILNLLASKNGGRDGKFNDFNLRSERTRMASWTLDALRARLSEIKTKQRMSAAPLSDLKTYVKEAHADKRPFPGFPNLPKSIWDGTKAVPVNATFFRGLDAYELRRYCRLYSTEQINQRMAEG